MALDESRRAERDALIRRLHAEGQSTRRIGRNPGVRLSASQVHAILKAGASEDLNLSADDVVGVAGSPLDRLDDAMRVELLTLVPHPEEQVRLAHHRARYRDDISVELRAWLDLEVARSVG